MFLFQIMLMALRGLRANLLRSLLATLGVIIGVGAVISSMSILAGTQRNIADRFETLGSESLTVIPGAARSGGRAAPAEARSPRSGRLPGGRDAPAEESRDFA